MIQFLLANGEHPHFQITPKLYTQSLCVRGAFSGSTATCRSSPFWPIADTDGSGTSARDEGPSSRPTAFNGTYYSLPWLLCEEVDARTFGPTDWAIILFDIKDVDPDLVQLHSLYIVINDGLTTQNIYFTDPSGQINAVSWLPNYGYLHYRNLKDLGQLDFDNEAPTHPTGVSPPKNMDFGFAFTPGAHNENTKITIYCTLRILSSKKLNQRRFHLAAEDTKGENTITQSIQIDKNLSPAMRSGVSGLSLSSSSSRAQSSASSSSSSNTSSITIGALAAACGVLLVVIAGMALYIVRGSNTNTAKRVNSVTA